MRLLQVLPLLQKVLLCYLLRTLLHPWDVLTMGSGQVATWGRDCPAWAPHRAALALGRAGSWEVALAELCHCFSPLSSAARYAGDGHLPGPESPFWGVGEEDKSPLPC